MEKKVFMTDIDMARTIARISYSVCENLPADNLVILGIYTGGAVLARRISDFLKNSKGIDVPVGVLDITLYRDDIKSDADYKDKTEIDFDINNKNLLLVDDVLYTGRTARSALAAINSLGRPKTVSLAVLIDRGHRELPIKPDFVGKNIPTAAGQKVEVRFNEIDGKDEVEIL